MLNQVKFTQSVRYARWALFNFFVLAIVGVILRYMHNFAASFINYKFLLHSHSHFAFSGWMFLAIAVIFIKHYSSDKPSKTFTYLFFATMLVSYGMLVSFFLSGYNGTSIALSALFVFVTYWFVFEVFRLKMFSRTKGHIANILLKGSFFYLVLSSFGPYALGYFKASGVDSLAAQENSIYFYLHFQMNGFMQLALLGLLLLKYVPRISSKLEVIWAKILVYSTLPLYFIFTLWINPPTWCYVLGFAGAVLHFISWIVLVYKLKISFKKLSLFSTTAFIAITFQFLLQLLICFPAVGSFVFSNHNLIIGYIHLITLGSLTPLILDFFIADGFLPKLSKINLMLIAGVIIYLLLLFGGPFVALFGIYIPNLEMLLLITNLLFPVFAGVYFFSALLTKKEVKSQFIKTI